MNADLHRRVLAAVLLLASLRTACASTGGPPADLLAGEGACPAPLPELGTSGALRLAWLPGIGLARARELVEARPRLGAPLTLARLALLPGMGDSTVAEIADWYAAGGRRNAAGVPEARCQHVRSPPRGKEPRARG